MFIRYSKVCIFHSSDIGRIKLKDGIHISQYLPFGVQQAYLRVLLHVCESKDYFAIVDFIAALL